MPPDTSSVGLAVSDGVDNEVSVTEIESDDSVSHESGELHQLSMTTIRSRLTPTICSYRYSHRLTNESSSSRAPRLEGGGEKWVRGFGRLLAVCNHPLSYTCENPSRKRHMPSKESHFAVNNTLLMT
jgi:hypothetical protein